MRVDAAGEAVVGERAGDAIVQSAPLVRPPRRPRRETRDRAIAPGEDRVDAGMGVPRVMPVRGLRSARERKATTHVVTAPISTYQVNATGVTHHTTVITIRPAIMPANVSRSRTDGASVPSRNAPSTAPDANDSTASPASRTDDS